MKEILAFLKQLSSHNNRDWMQANKKEYERAKEIFKQEIDKLIKGISQFDESVQGLEPKDCIFRINRDIRFSKDKSPYKTNFGAAMMEGGKKTSNPTYYLHVEPGKSFLAGGVYMPLPENLKKIRQEIDYNPQELKQVVESKPFKNSFGAMTGEQLKTAPKGYPKDHPNIEMLRFKSFIATRNISDHDLTDEDYMKDILGHFKVLYPFNQYFAVAMS